MQHRHRTSRSSRHGTGFLVGAFLLVGASCSLVVETRAKQCDKTQDCLGRGPAFAATICSDGMCVGNALLDAGHESAPPTGCTSNAACSNQLGVEAICHKSDGVCSPLLTTDCANLIGNVDDIANDDVLVVGALAPSDGPKAPTGAALRNAVILAWNEIHGASGGLPMGQNGKVRPFLVVSCSDSIDPVRAARHLVEEVRVPAILGPGSLGATLEVAKQTSMSGKVLLITSTETTSQLTGLDDGNTVWRTAPSEGQQLNAMARLAEGTEVQLRTSLGLAATDPIKLAIVHKGDVASNAQVDGITAVLKLNGKAAADNGASFLNSDYGDPLDPQNTQPKDKYAISVASVLQQRPHMIVFVGGEEGFTDVLPEIEKSWTAMVPYHPVWLFLEANRDATLLTWVGSDQTLAARVLGIELGTANSAFQAFVGRYQAAFQDGTDPALFGIAGAYDAVYLLAYAAVASGLSEPDGLGVVEGLKKLVPPGGSVEVGPAGVPAAFGQLRGGQHVDLDGASGPLNFDVATGDVSSDYRVWCLSTASAGFKTNGQYYSAKTDSLAGKAVCP